MPQPAALWARGPGASRLPILEAVAARDWKRAVAESGVAAEAAIDAACAKMGKPRAQVAPILP